MYPTRRQPSYTLPRNFIFHLNDGESPIPPQSLTSTAPSRAPTELPRHIGPYRLRRRRETRTVQPEHFVAPDLSDVPLPTIEVSDPSSRTHSLQVATMSQLVRPRQSPPRTPVPQTQVSEVDQEMSIDQSEASSQGESISRPSTACSGFSDSSVSSSIESFPSLGESFTSPEADALDFCQHHNPAEKPVGEPSSAAQNAHNHSSKRPGRKSDWTDDMDSHLWMTYMRYLQDPTHTPFKMLPGTAPPLGVCARVVREAKRTWKGTRPCTNSRVHQLMPWGQVARAESPDTVELAHSGSTTPTETQMVKRPQSWPRSDASTRRRLRELCKSKPTLSAHYNRFLTTRSPSPFLSSPGSRSSSLARDVHPHAASLHPGSSFSTRDMTLSLFSSTSSAVTVMNQLTADSATPKPIEANIFQRPSSRLGAHQKSQSLQLNLGVLGREAGIDGFLASPFQPLRRPQADQQTAVDDALGTPIATAPGLASPYLHTPIPQSRIKLNHSVMNSEASHLAPSETQTPLPNIDGFAQHLRIRRGRSRAVSMGDVNARSRQLSLLFEPPRNTETSAHPLGSQAKEASSSSSNLLPPSVIGPIRRLGSPFSERASRPLFNTFPRNFAIHGLAPTIELQEERYAGPPSPNAADLER